MSAIKTNVTDKTPIADVKSKIDISSESTTAVKSCSEETSHSSSPNDENKLITRKTIQSVDTDTSATTWDAKPFDEERTYREFFTIEFILGTISHLKNRDWSSMVWRNVAYIGIYHVFGLVGLYLLFSSGLSWKLRFWLFGTYLFAGVGVTGGMHRLWSHKSYKASTALEIILACAASMSFENSIYVWSRDHRVHHKYSETPADPHDSHRGIFFAHMGWLMQKKHDDVTRMGKTIDMDDLKANKIVMFQHRHYLVIMLLFTFIIPTFLPVLLWNENVWHAYAICALRLCLVHHGTWLVNSISHWQGPHPYDNTIWPCENIVTGIVALGEGWHNYHHRFPNDYRATDRDFGALALLFNFTQCCLDFCAKLGMVRDPIKASPKLIATFKSKYGDQSEPILK